MVMNLKLLKLVDKMRSCFVSWFDRTNLEIAHGADVIAEALDQGLIEDVHGHSVMLTEVGEHFRWSRG